MGSSGLIILAAVMLFGIWRRVRMTVQYQPLTTRRLVMRPLSLLVLTVLVLLPGARGMSWTPLILGAAAGVALGFVSLSTTHFVERDGGWTYRPHRLLGTALLVFFLVRVGYRLYLAAPLMEHAQAGAPSTAAALAALYVDPWTLAMYLLLVGYYVTYHLLLLSKMRTLGESTPPRPAS